MNALILTNIYIIMKSKFYKMRTSLLHETNKLFKYYRGYLFLLFVIFLICFITGIMTCSKYSSSVTHEHLINKYLSFYLTKESTYVGFFLTLSAYFLIINLFVILFTRNMIVAVIDVVIFALLSYIVGFDICIIIFNFGVAGVLFGILVLGLFQLVILLIIMLIISIAIKRIREFKKSCEGMPKTYFIKVYCLLLSVGVIVIFLMSILFGVIHIFVIVD